MVELFTSRIEKLRSFFKKKQLQNILILIDENIFYLTGFYGKDSASLLFVTSDCIYLLVHFIYLEQAKKSIKNKNINIICFGKDKFKKLAEILKDYKSRSVAVEDKNISFADYSKLEKILSGQGKKLIGTSEAVERLRVVKDDIEISRIKKACKITDKAFKSLLNSDIHRIDKLSEVELALRIEELLIENNSSGSSFDIIVAYGKNSSMPHYSPQKIKINDGIILMDFGCRFENYCSDITRTIFIGNNKICNEFKKIYDIVLEAQIRAIENCREGITAGELDGIARKFISSKGYGANFGHGLGHGVGLEVHEQPVINSKNKTILKENMIITIEPAIYIENFGGIRIEDMVLVKKNGCEVLYNSRKDFFILS